MQIGRKKYIQDPDHNLFFQDRRFLKHGYHAEFNSGWYPFFRILIAVTQYERGFFFKMF